MEDSFKESVEGVVMFHRSNADDRPKCACCHGETHVHGKSIKIPSVPSEIFTGLPVETVSDFLYEWLSKHQWQGIENKKVRVTIELVE